MKHNEETGTVEFSSGKVVRHSGLAEIISAYGSLFASFTTLFCCALPAVLVLLGFSLTGVLTFFTAIPGWEEVGGYDMWLFLASAVLLLFGFVSTYLLRGPGTGDSCELAPGSGKRPCSTATRWNRRILWLAVLLFVIAMVMNFWGIGWMKAHGYFKHPA